MTTVRYFERTAIGSTAQEALDQLHGRAIKKLVLHEKPDGDVVGAVELDFDDLADGLDWDSEAVERRAAALKALAESERVR